MKIIKTANFEDLISKMEQALKGILGDYEETHVPSDEDVSLDDISEETENVPSTDEEGIPGGLSVFVEIDKDGDEDEDEDEDGDILNQIIGDSSHYHVDVDDDAHEDESVFV